MVICPAATALDPGGWKGLLAERCSSASSTQSLPHSLLPQLGDTCKLPPVTRFFMAAQVVCNRTAATQRGFAHGIALADLHEELLHRIFAELPQIDLMRVRLVSRGLLDAVGRMPPSLAARLRVCLPASDNSHTAPAKQCASLHCMGNPLVSAVQGQLGCSHTFAAVMLRRYNCLSTAPQRRVGLAAAKSGSSELQVPSHPLT